MTRVITRNPFEVQVSFTKAELALCLDEAKKRQTAKEAHSDVVTDKRIANRDNTVTHMIGLLGEYAVAKLIGGKVDTEFYLAGDTGKDFSIYGITLEVKTLQGFLTFRSMADFKADLAALVIYDRQDYSAVWVQGFISRKEFHDTHFIDNFGYGDRPCIQPADLLPIATLKTYCLTTRNQRWLLGKIDELRTI